MAELNNKIINYKGAKFLYDDLYDKLKDQLGLLSNYKLKQVNLASTENVDVLSLSTLTIDGVAVSTVSSVLLKDQINKKENGLYVKGSDGNFTSDISIQETFLFTGKGKTNKNKVFYSTSKLFDGSIDITFKEFIGVTPSVRKGHGVFSVESGDENCKALSPFSHAEGRSTYANGDYSHAEGGYSYAGGWKHKETGNIELYDKPSEAEIANYTLVGNYSHAEGERTEAIGNYSHAEGYATGAYGQSSHTEGKQTVANGTYSHAEGSYNAYEKYDAQDPPQRAEGTEGTMLRTDAATNGKSSLLTVGCGGYNSESSRYDRKNALEVWDDGQVWVDTLNGKKVDDLGGGLEDADTKDKISARLVNGDGSANSYIVSYDETKKELSKVNKSSFKGDKGEQGQAGPQGPAGQEGPKGKDCDAIKIVSTNLDHHGNSGFNLNGTWYNHKGRGTTLIAINISDASYNDMTYNDTYATGTSGCNILGDWAQNKIDNNCVVCMCTYDAGNLSGKLLNVIIQNGCQDAVRWEYRTSSYCAIQKGLGIGQGYFEADASKQLIVSIPLIKGIGILPKGNNGLVGFPLMKTLCLKKGETKTYFNTQGYGLITYSVVYNTIKNLNKIFMNNDTISFTNKDSNDVVGFIYTEGSDNTYLDVVPQNFSFIVTNSTITCDNTWFYELLTGSLAAEADIVFRKGDNDETCELIKVTIGSGGTSKTLNLLTNMIYKPVLKGTTTLKRKSATPAIILASGTAPSDNDAYNKGDMFITI